MTNLRPLDHETATDRQKRGHYASGCRDQACRDAVAAAARDAKIRRIEAAAAQTTAEPSSEGESTEPSSPAESASPSPEPTAVPLPKPPVVAGRTASIGASRRLQGLVFAGHAPEHLAAELGLPLEITWWLLLGTPFAPEMISDRAHATIATGFKRLRDVVPAPSSHRDRAIALADINLWSSPYAWNDIDQDPTPTHGGRTKKQAPVAIDTSPDHAKLREDLAQAQRALTSALAERQPLRDALSAERALTAAAEVRIAEAGREVEAALAECRRCLELLEAEKVAHSNTQSLLEAAESELVALGQKWQELAAEGARLKEVVDAPQPASSDDDVALFDMDTLTEGMTNVTVNFHLHVGGSAAK